MKQFKISGQERRTLKQKYSDLKSYVKNFWHHHYLDQDMNTICSMDVYQITDCEAKIKFDKSNQELSELELLLKEPYKSVSDLREEAINKIIE